MFKRYGLNVPFDDSPRPRIRSKKSTIEMALGFLPSCTCLDPFEYHNTVTVNGNPQPGGKCNGANCYCGRFRIAERNIHDMDIIRRLPRAVAMAARKELAPQTGLIEWLPYNVRIKIAAWEEKLQRGLSI